MSCATESLLEWQFTLTHGELARQARHPLLRFIGWLILKGFKSAYSVFDGTYWNNSTSTRSAARTADTGSGLRYKMIPDWAVSIDFTVL